jgi:hypothetical protein
MAKPVVPGAGALVALRGSLSTGPKRHQSCGLPGRECYLSSRSDLLPILPVAPG